MFAVSRLAGSPPLSVRRAKKAEAEELCSHGTASSLRKISIDTNNKRKPQCCWQSVSVERIGMKWLVGSLYISPTKQNADWSELKATLSRLVNEKAMFVLAGGFK